MKLYSHRMPLRLLVAAPLAATAAIVMAVTICVPVQASDFTPPANSTTVSNTSGLFTVTLSGLPEDVNNDAEVIFSLSQDQSNSQPNASAKDSVTVGPLNAAPGTILFFQPTALGVTDGDISGSSPGPIIYRNPDSGLANETVGFNGTSTVTFEIDASNLLTDGDRLIISDPAIPDNGGEIFIVENDPGTFFATGFTDDGLTPGIRDDSMTATPELSSGASFGMLLGCLVLMAVWRGRRRPSGSPHPHEA